MIFETDPPALGSIMEMGERIALIESSGVVSADHPDRQGTRNRLPVGGSRVRSRSIMIQGVQFGSQLRAFPCRFQITPACGIVPAHIAGVQ